MVGKWQRGRPGSALQNKGKVVPSKREAKRRGERRNRLSMKDRLCRGSRYCGRYPGGADNQAGECRHSQVKYAPASRKSHGDNIKCSRCQVDGREYKALRELRWKEL